MHKIFFIQDYGGNELELAELNQTKNGHCRKSQQDDFLFQSKGEYKNIN